MLRPRAVCSLLALLSLAVVPLSHAALIPDSLRDMVLEGLYEASGPAAAATPAGDLLLVSSFLAFDSLNRVYSPIVGRISGPAGEQVGSFSIDPRGPGGEGGAGAARFGAAASASGRFLVVWERRSETVQGWDLLARFFDRQGQPTGSLEVLAESTAGEARSTPAVACNLVARCVVAWRSDRHADGLVAVEGRVLDSISHPDQESFRFDTAAAAGQSVALAVTVSDHGHFAVLATEQRPTFRLFAGTGALIGGAVPLLAPGGPPAPGGPRGGAAGAFDAAGNLVAAFTQAGADGRSGLWAQRFGLTGQPLGEPLRVNEVGSPLAPQIVWSGESQRFVAGWKTATDDESLDRLVLRALAPDGRPEGAEQVAEDVSVQGLPILRDAALAILPASRVGVYWNRLFFGPVGTNKIAAQRYRLGPESCGDAEPPAERARCVRLGPGERFQVTAAFRGDQGRSAPADLEALTANAAFLFFRGEENPEVVTKILDGRPINGSFWYFSGAMSNQEYQVTAFDTETGRVASYYNPPALLRSLADTSTFVDAPLADASAAEPVAGDLLSLGLSERWAPEPQNLLFTPAAGKAAGGTGCLIPTPTSLCLNQARFRVEVRWTDFAGNTGQATAVQTTADGGYFWFFNPNNVELALKILDGRPINGHFWVFYASLSNVRFVVRIYDESGNQVKVYRNPPRTLASVADTQAF